MPTPTGGRPNNLAKLALLKINEALYPLLFPCAMTRNGLKMITAALVDPLEKKAVEDAVVDISRAFDFFDRNARETAEAAAKAIEASRKALAGVPPDIRAAIEAGMEQGNREIAATSMIAAAQAAKRLPN